MRVCMRLSDSMLPSSSTWFGLSCEGPAMRRTGAASGRQFCRSRQSSRMCSVPDRQLPDNEHYLVFRLRFRLREARSGAQVSAWEVVDVVVARDYHELPLLRQQHEHVSNDLECCAAERHRLHFKADPVTRYGRCMSVQYVAVRRPWTRRLSVTCHNL